MANRLFISFSGSARKAMEEVGILGFYPCLFPSNVIAEETIILKRAC